MGERSGEQGDDGSATLQANAVFEHLPAVAASAPLNEQLYQILEEAIVSGQLAPGQRLDEKELADHFGVSRIPVREAFRGLEVAGWIERGRPRQGTRVRAVTDADLARLTEVRRTLDGECAALAARRRTETQLHTLHGILDQARTAVQRDDRAGLVRLNSEFHTCLARCTQNDVFTEILSVLDKRVRLFLMRADPEIHRASLEEHELLVQAIERGDAREAQSIARRHATQQPTSALAHSPDADQLPTPKT
jgi:DNA-binding GntR family transcriptional regulator